MDTFSATGTLTIPVEQPMYLYQVVKGELEAVDAVYNEEEQAMQLKTKSLGNYVLTEEKLEIAAKPQQKPQAAPQQENALPQENAGNGVMQENSSNDYLSGGDKGNPDTGAQDLSAVMAALAVVSLAGGLTLLKGKK